VQAASGLYSGSYAGCRETFDLNVNGSFTQTCTVGQRKIYENSGKWSVSDSEITFENYFQIFDTERNVLREAPEVFTQARFKWISDPGAIILDNINLNYRVMKIEKPR